MAYFELGIEVQKQDKRILQHDVLLNLSKVERIEFLDYFDRVPNPYGVIYFNKNCWTYENKANFLLQQKRIRAAVLTSKEQHKLTGLNFRA